MAEEEKGKTKEIQLQSVHTLEQNKAQQGEVQDEGLYLHRNGNLLGCPFKVMVSPDGIPIGLPCGDNCPHFNIIIERKPHDGGKDKMIPTGRVIATLSCGGAKGRSYPIDNMRFDPKNQSGLKKAD